jgi:hypothetical protein
VRLGIVQSTQADRKSIMQQLHSSGKLRAVFRLRVFVKSTSFYKFCESQNIFRKEDWIVKQLFMAFVAENSSHSFLIPRTRLKNAVGFGSPAVDRPSEKAFGNEVMAGRMRPALDRRTRIASFRSVKQATTERASLNLDVVTHIPLGLNC